jgi:hypothetical protein
MGAGLQRALKMAEWYSYRWLIEEKSNDVR